MEKEVARDGFEMVSSDLKKLGKALKGWWLTISCWTFINAILIYLQDTQMILIVNLVLIALCVGAAVGWGVLRSENTKLKAELERQRSTK